MLGRPDLLVPNKQRGLAMAMRENYAYIDTKRGLRAALHDLHAKSIEVSSGHVGTTIMSLATHKTCFYRNAFSTVRRSLKSNRTRRGPPAQRLNGAASTASRAQLDAGAVAGGERSAAAAADWSSTAALRLQRPPTQHMPLQATGLPRKAAATFRRSHQGATGPHRGPTQPA
ncbi:hypothetical protein V5799_032308 [Amblyomma americanum]|uniref:Uncharacterized protein n=1 Tax=Amblyomma americanum TaxID=6943 RepID=A0AAQ4DRJ3_AMBAM